MREIYRRAGGRVTAFIGLENDSLSATSFAVRGSSDVWVIQEVVNAAQPAIICGSQHLSWDDIAYAVQCVADSSMFAATDAAPICGDVAFLKRSQDMYLDGLPDWHAHDRVAPLGLFSDSSGQQEVAFSPGLDAITLGGRVKDEVIAISDTIQPFQDSIQGLQYRRGAVQLVRCNCSS